MYFFTVNNLSHSSPSPMLKCNLRHFERPDKCETVMISHKGVSKHSAKRGRKYAWMINTDATISKNKSYHNVYKLEIK